MATPISPYSSLLAVSAGTSALASIGAAYEAAQSARAQADYQRRVAAINLRFGELAAQDVLRRGEREAQRVKLKTRALIGRQRVALAAQGISLESGAPLEIQEETAAQGAMDALTVRNNAWREAWGYQVQALNVQTGAAFTELSARAQARSSLLTGGLQAVRDVAQAGYYLSGGKR